MHNPTISVVVPVYNAGQYLAPCIDSILGQTFCGFEVLLIDDGSTDGSGCLCDKYAKMDARVRVLHKENEGINATRQRGVHEAKGQWVVFCDDDDTMTANSLQSLYNMHDGSDIVIGFSILPKKRLTNNATLEDCRRALLTGDLSVTPWAKLYRKSLLTDDVFDFPREIDGEEDMIMNTRLLFKTSSPPRILYQHIYNFRRNPVSKSHTKRASIAHEVSFYKALYASIPEEQLSKYLEQITFMKLNGLFPIAYKNPDSLKNKKQPYIQLIKSDIKAYHYHLSIKERIILYSKSKYILKITGFVVLAIRSIRYRLK